MGKKRIVIIPYTMLKKNQSRSTIHLNVKGEIDLLDNNTEYHYDLRRDKYLLSRT